MDFEEFKNTLMDLVSKEVDDRGLEDISMKFTTVDSPDGMTERLMVSVGEAKMSMAFRLQEIYKNVEDGEDIDHAVYKIVNTIESSISVIKEKEQDVKNFISDYDHVRSSVSDTLFRSRKTSPLSRLRRATLRLSSQIMSR